MIGKLEFLAKRGQLCGICESSRFPRKQLGISLLYGGLVEQVDREYYGPGQANGVSGCHGKAFCAVVP